mgnify:CR=1 FL=1
MSAPWMPISCARSSDAGADGEEGDSTAGRSALEQQFTRPNGAARTDVIAAAGSGSASDYTHHAEIPETTWRVAFTPSIGLVNSLSADRLPLFAALALCLLGMIGALAMLTSPRTAAAFDLSQEPLTVLACDIAAGDDCIERAAAQLRERGIGRRCDRDGKARSHSLRHALRSRQVAIR